ncbi:MAG: tyrosine-type recombinase/integrase [Candidatus Omnitrophota bacterium]
MRDKEKAKNYNALYRKEHWFAIKIKNQMYRDLPHVKKRRKEYNKTRKEYFKKYYEKHKERFKEKAILWAKENPEKKRLIQKRFKEKLKRRQKRRNMKSKIERILNDFLEYCKDRYDEETVRHYRMNVRRFHSYIEQHKTRSKEYHARFYQESKKLPEERDLSWMKEFRRIQYVEELNRDFITRYVSFVNHDEISENTNLPLSQSEKESRLYPLKTFLRFCQRKGYIKENLTRFIYVPPREKKVLKRVMTQEEMAKFLEIPDITSNIGIRNRALLELSYSGLRAEEMLSLKLGNVDTISNSVTILNGKGDKDRVIPMTNEAIYWIKRWLNRRNLFVNNRIDTEYLFITKGNKPIHKRSFSKMVKNYVRLAKIELDISPHDLRRTTATHLAENGAPIRQIQALLGHSSLRVTAKYLRLTDETIKKEHKKTHPSHRRSLHYGDIQR